MGAIQGIKGQETLLLKPPKFSSEIIDSRMTAVLKKVKGKLQSSSNHLTAEGNRFSS